uniref:DUF3105 domain-containing protein n=1 Tax=candidate division WWE3 bacterium TaxID=2053526 RepID=A0A832E0N6_UNCKA
MASKKIRQTFTWLAVIGVAGGLLYQGYQWLSRPLPGEAVADLGRAHIAVGTAREYNSNPPTSGPHYAEWTRAGIYDQPIEDGYLIHSLEHGYVIMSYRCEQLTGGGEQVCKEFQDKLGALAEDLGIKKLIVVPRPTLDVPLALTAWTRLLKLEAVDEPQIRSFVHTFRNAGPEQTVE